MLTGLGQRARSRRVERDVAEDSGHSEAGLLASCALSEPDATESKRRERRKGLVSSLLLLAFGAIVPV